MSIAADGRGPETFLWRLQELEGFRAQFGNWQREVDDDRSDLRHLQDEVKGLNRAVDSLRRTILGFALSVAGSAIVFSLSILVATGKL